MNFLWNELVSCSCAVIVSPRCCRYSRSRRKTMFLPAENAKPVHLPLLINHNEWGGEKKCRTPVSVDLFLSTWTSFDKTILLPQRSYVTFSSYSLNWQFNDLLSCYVIQNKHTTFRSVNCLAEWPFVEPVCSRTGSFYAIKLFTVFTKSLNEYQ